MKWREHTSEHAREVERERSRKATEKYSTLSLPWFAEYAILKLEELGEHGLWTCYRDAEDYLWDFFMDLPWHQEKRRLVIKMILNDPRFPDVIASIKEGQEGFDFKEVLDGALTEKE